MAELPLARDFPPADEAAWKALVEEALKGAPVSALTSRSYDGIAINPLYPRAEDAQVIARRAAGTPWAVMQRLDLPDADAANAQILEDLNNGASGAVLVFGGAVGDYGYALPHGEAEIARALEGVHLDWGIDLTLDFGPPSREAARIVVDRVKALGLAPGGVKLRFGFDPLGALAVHGALPKPWSDIAPVVAGMIGDLASQGFTGPYAVADARPVHAAGGSEAQELAFALANAVTYLRVLEAGGIALDEARRFIFFRLPADQDQFLTVAKFRALRKLWARVEDASGLAPEPAFVTAETAWRMMTKRDPHGNIVRGTIAALAAAVGGADAIAVLPFSAALGVPDAFARRVARNTQTILIEEANIHRVADPAAGSGAIEALTDALCAGAWTLFQAIEHEGGSANALESGLIQKGVAKVRAARQANVARRKESLVGTSDFPALAEDSVAVLATLESSSRPKASGNGVEPLPRTRLAEPFERLRDASDAYLAEHGARPKVFLACLGSPSDFNAQASFAKSLFESGGIEAVDGSGDKLMKDFNNSGAKLACLCSSDKVYASEATSTAKALIQAGAKGVYLAGKPTDQAALMQAGISTFLPQGCDTLAILEAAYEQI
ncbi:MAG: methylmalonyl-CoA mutase family protein [Methyloceanibacter sp.]|uniref:methylmalonyl-CoA mutase family protein n=1 Tax=Methyloceanibacter sp. TaxID=1965321 RepID=UPI003D9B7506